MDTSHVLLPGQGGSWPGPSASPPARLCPQAMAATTVTDSGGVRIITEVIPATDPRAAQLAAGSRSPAPTASSFQVRGFRRAQPKALGVRHGVPGGTGHLGGKAGTEYPQGLSCLRFSLAGAEVMFGTGSRRCAKCQHTQLSQVPSRHRGTQPGRGVTVGSGWDAANSNGDIHPLPVLADRQRFGPRVTGGIPLPQTIHIFTGIIHVCFGIILMVSEYRTPSLPVASGVLFWLGLLLLLSGSLLVESEKRENISLVRGSPAARLGGTKHPPVAPATSAPSSGWRDPSAAWIHPAGSPARHLRPVSPSGGAQLSPRRAEGGQSFMVQGLHEIFGAWWSHSWMMGTKGVTEGGFSRSGFDLS
ncbi:membrane-spanning 4-domains subfamily A member 15 isoform 1-T1 [Sarcoramphus papa]